MLKRIYVDNYKALVNFELQLTPRCLLVGDNGSGKSSVFEVLYNLRQFITGQGKTDQLFDTRRRTRWQDRTEQTFELDVEGNGGVYTYRLVIEHEVDTRKSRVKEERLKFDQKPLYGYFDEEAHLYADNFKAGPKFPIDWSQSGLAFLHPRGDNKLLTWFKNRIEHFVIASLEPPQMSVLSSAEDRVLSKNGYNFASWYRFQSQEQIGKVMQLTEKLREVIPGFHSMNLFQESAGVRSLKVKIETQEKEKTEEDYGFDELSDGQRQLIALYSLLIGVGGPDYSLFLDEPDNYVSLQEIHPWLNALTDACEEARFQTTIISHHPELINYLGGSSGVWFFRDENGPTRVGPLSSSAEGLKLSEAVARRWNNE